MARSTVPRGKRFGIRAKGKLELVYLSFILPVRERKRAIERDVRKTIYNLSILGRALPTHGKETFGKKIGTRKRF